MAADQGGALRVVRVYRRLPPATGGMELHIARLSQAQRHLGVDVLLIHNVGAADGPAIRVLPNFDLDTIKPQSLRNLIFYLAAARRVSSLPKATPIVLHIHGAWSDFLFSKLLAYVLGARATFASIHGVVRPRWVWLYRLALSHCEEVFATGKAEQEFLATALDRSVVHLPSGLAPEFVAPTTVAVNRFDVVSVSNLVPKKRADLVVECARLRPELRFAIVGDGPMRSSLEKMLADHAVQNVSVLGRQSPKVVSEILQASRMFLSTSEEEGAPTAALEAMAVGLPVVLAPSNDFRWLVEPGVNGLITRSWEVPEFVGCIDSILADDARRLEMGSRNRETLKDHVWSNIAERLTRLMAARANPGHSS